MPRNIQKPPDSNDIIQALQDRVRKLETAQRAGWSAFGNQQQLTILGDLAGFRFIPTGASYENSATLYTVNDPYFNNSLIMAVEQYDPNINDFWQSGGKVQLWNAAAVLSEFRPMQGYQESFVWLGHNQPEEVRIRGAARLGVHYDQNDFMEVGIRTTAAGFSQATTTYAAGGFATTPIPIVVMNALGGGFVNWMMSQQNNSSFIMNWNDTGAKQFNYLAIRTIP